MPSFRSSIEADRQMAVFAHTPSASIASRFEVTPALSCSIIIVFLSFSEAQAQSNSVIDVCAGLGITLPHLQTVSPVGSSFAVLGLNTALNSLVGDVNQRVVAPLSDLTLRVGVLDTNGNLVSIASPGGCNLSASSLSLDASRGLAIGGGRISGLGSLSASGANANDVSAIALGAGATTSIGSVNTIAVGNSTTASGNGALAFGLRGTVNGNDAIALGTDANATASYALAVGAGSTASVSGGVALGRSSVADRLGLNGAAEAYTATTVPSTNGAVSVGATGTERQIIHVAGGTRPTDAVNLRQLSAVGSNLAASFGGGAGFNATTGAYTPPSFTILGGTYNTVGGALGALDTRVAINTTAISSNAADLQVLQGQFATSVTLTLQDTTSRTVTLGRDTDGGLVSITGTGGDRRLTGVAAGLGINDAANVAQLRGSGNALAGSLGAGAAFNVTTGTYTGPSYTVGGSSYGSVGGAIGALEGLSVQYTPNGAGSATGSIDLSRGGSLGSVSLRGVGPGLIAVGSTEAINGSQLSGITQQLTTNTTDIANLQSSTGSGPSFLSQDITTRAIALGASTNGSLLTVAGTAGDRRLTGVATGTASNDAVNVGQLSAALINVGTSGSSPAMAVSNQAALAIPFATGTDAVALGYGASAGAARSVALGSGSIATQADTVSIGAPGSERRIVNVANGTVGFGSTDAVNGGQLHVIGQSVAANTASLAALQTGIGGSAAAVVLQDPGSGAITVGASSAGSTINFSSLSGRSRTLHGVAEGNIGVGSTQAVNGGQLFATNQQAATDSARITQGIAVSAQMGSRIAASMGGNARFEAATGTLTAPTYSLRGTSYGDVGSALSALDVALTTTTADLGTITRQIETLGALGADGSGSLVLRDSTGTSIIIGSQIGGAVINVAGTEGPRRVSGVADGIDSGDAVNVGQLDKVAQSFEVRLQDIPIRANNTRRADAPVATGQNAYASGYGARAEGTGSVAIGSMASARGAEATSIGTDSSASAERSTAAGARSVARGVDSAAFGQSSSATASGTTAIGASAQATSTGATAIGAGARAIADPATAVGYQTLASGNEASAFGAFAQATSTDATALGRSASATGTGASAIGVNASAEGGNSTALGRGARASHSNATAIGAGAVATRPNQISLGTASSTYTLTGVATAQSAAAQNGQTRYVTSDASGNLAIGEFGPNSLAEVQERMGAFSTQIDGLSRYVAASRREARQGVAAAMAMTSAPMPSLPGKTSWAANTAAFRGEWAGGVALAHRLDTNVPIAITAGYSYGQANQQGLRAGLAGEF